MATDHAASVQGVALRVAKLGADGAPLVGTTNAYVTNAFMSLSFTPEYTEGDEVEEKAADGSVCVYYKMPDVLKRVTFELAVCAPDPEFYEVIAGGTILSALGASKTVSNKALTSNVATLTTSTAHGFVVGDTVTVAGVDSTFNGSYEVTVVGSSTTFSYAKTAANVSSTAATGTAAKTTGEGWAAPSTGIDPTPNGVSMEVWSRAIVAGKPAAVNPYWRWVFPYTQMRLTGDRTLENGMMANTFEGWGVGNAEWGDGPVGDWPHISDRAYQYARAADYPEGINGYQAVVADA